MYFTLAQAREALSGGSTGAYTSTNLDRDINRAVHGLSTLSGWECLRKTVRFVSAGPVFALPQGYAGLVRVCVNGRPTTLRGQDFRFLQSGPGDLRRPPAGFVPVPPKNVVDAGLSALISEPSEPFRLVAFTDAGTPAEAGALVVTGTGLDGRTVQARLSPYRMLYYEETGEPAAGTYDVADAEPAPVTFARVDEVVVDGASSYITLYAAAEADLADRWQVARYNPRIQVPRFRRYEIAGVPPGAPVEVLAEARLDFVPLVLDTDVLPFQALEPIEWMIRADWAMKSGEVVQAQNYRNQAMNWLKAQEVTDDTVQTQVVVNSVFDGSMGQLSEEADNI